MSHAIAPPTVTCRVPGSTGTHSPSGNAARISWSRLTPASTSTRWVSLSMVWMRFSAVMSTTRPPPFCALSPYERPIPRAMTPRAPVSEACETALAITSASGGDSTCATLGAVRAQPVSRWGLVSNIVTRVPPGFRGSAQPEYDRPLDHEVDHSRGALGDDERDRFAPGRVVERCDQDVVEPDLHDKRGDVEGPDRGQPRGARRRLERPAPVQ